jgi:hypothetical protein
MLIGLVAGGAAILRAGRVQWLATAVAIFPWTLALGASPAAGHIPTPTVTAVNLGATSLEQVPLTFGEPFRNGEIPHGDTVVAYSDGQPLPTQTDIKARNPDGSVRHAILTVELPSLAGRASVPLNFRAIPDSEQPTHGHLSLDDILQTGFDASVILDIAGEPWHLDARELLGDAQAQSLCKPYGRDCNLWLSGPLVSEWVVGGPVLDVHGKPNPHIAVYFAVRAYGPAPVHRVRVDVIVENDWAYAPDPQNVTYDATIRVNGRAVYTIDHLEHYVQARWHKVFWWGKSDPVYAQQDSEYLQATRAVPRYENVEISPQVLKSAVQRAKRRCAPMKPCDQTKNQANAGAQAAIGPLPRWTSAYVIDPNPEAYEWMLANSDALGSYGIHYREQRTGKPVSVEDHPCVTLERRAEFSRCPVEPHGDDNFPRCKDRCRSPLRANISHHPSPAYVAYLVTGDWYYLEELKFWADWVEFKQNPRYRGYTKGMIYHANPRGQAWSLRTLGYAAYILPDRDPLKMFLNDAVENNIKWYNERYTDNPSANALHVLTWDALSYTMHGKQETGIATWQHSFFTWSVGNLRDLGFPGADKLLEWMGAFQVNLMTSPDFCWIVASAYALQVRDTNHSPLYDTLGQVYVNTFPAFKNVACNSSDMAEIVAKWDGYRPSKNVMLGHGRSPTGFPANFQIGLAAAADSNIPNAKKAWSIFANRSGKPSYAHSPQFAVIPRDAVGK